MIETLIDKLFKKLIRTTALTIAVGGVAFAADMISPPLAYANPRGRTSVGPEGSVSADTQSLKETWYMYRAKENSKINNQKAAIEAYEKALEINPDNREASRNLGLAYESQGIADKAVNQYDNYLSKWPGDKDIALRQARLLKWGRYSYRQQDSAKYYKMSLNERDDSGVRLEYAETLGSKKDTSRQAIREYQSVLRKQPRNAAANRGLAKAYAWNGDQDQALYHAKLAKEYGGNSAEMRQLTSSIERDRRPELAAEVMALHQTSSQNFNLTGFSGGARTTFSTSPFSTANVHGGLERFWNDTSDASGVYLGAGGQYRLSTRTSVNGSFTYHTAFQDAFELNASYDWLSEENRPLRAGFRRDLIDNSYLSLVGETVNGTHLGAARKNTFFMHYETLIGENLDFEITPFAGWASAQSLSPNAVFGTDIELSIPFTNDPESRWSLVGRTHLESYQRDQSGLRTQAGAPEAGGYFSPSFFLNQEVLARYQSHGEKDEGTGWSFELGPSYQYVSGTTSDGSEFGGLAALSLLSKLDSNLFFQARGELARVGDVYTRAQATGALIYRF
jgi:tetratricopeptide (TPR) repeat protein